MQKKILQIDSGADTVRLVKTILEAEGHKVYTAWNKQSSLIVIKNEKPELVLVDVMMAEISAWELYQRIKKLNKGTKVVFLSNIPISEERKQDMLVSGISDYIMKPFTKEELVEKIRTILN
jgi:two-component system sensor histidine kinase ChiS